MANKNAQALGKLGGLAKAKKYGHEHFVAIGKKGKLKQMGNRTSPDNKTPKNAL